MLPVSESELDQQFGYTAVKLNPNEPQAGKIEV